MSRLLDANAILRYLLHDIPDQASEVDQAINNASFTTNTFPSRNASSFLNNSCVRSISSDRIIKGRYLASSTGKTYIGNALAINAVKQFRSVRYIKASYLMSEMEAENLKGNSLEYLKKISFLALLVIDDFGLMDLDPNKCRNLFEVLDSREGKGSTMIISQLPVSAWYDLFKDNTCADACMERAIRGAYRLEFNGKNMRNPSKN